MIILFTITSLAVLSFFLFRKGFDIYSLAAFSALIYFVPGFFGYDLWRNPIVDETYAVMITVMLSIMGYTVVVDRLSSRTLAPAVDKYDRIGHYYLALAVAVSAFVVVVYGIESLLVHKSRSGIPGGVYIVWRVVTSLLLVYAVASKRRSLIIGGMLAMALTFIASDRTGIALSMLAIALIVLGQSYSRRLITVIWKYVPWLAIGGALIVFGKFLFVSIHVFNSPAGIDGVKRLWNSASWENYVYNSEPFVTQAILNETIKQDFFVGPDHLVGVLFQVWPVPSMFGYSSGVFNEIFQPVLFPSTVSASSSWGLAYNYWGEALAAGGWLMLFTFICIYLVGLTLINAVIKSEVIAFRSLGALMGAYWAFYIHRNSIGSIITYERHIIYIFIIIFIAVYVLPRLRLHARPRGG